MVAALLLRFLLFIYLYDLFSLEKSLGLLKKLKTIEQFFT
jgi:hypothetical protein